MGHDVLESWAYTVVVILPSVMREWYDPTLRDFDSKDGEYYSTAYLKLGSLKAFKRYCPNAIEILKALKLLTAFFENETGKEVKSV